MVLEKVLEAWEFSGQWCPRKEEWPWERLSGAQESALLAYLVMCSGILDEVGTCCDPGVDQNLTTTDAPFASSSFQFKREEGSGLISPLV